MARVGGDGEVVEGGVPVSVGGGVGGGVGGLDGASSAVVEGSVVGLMEGRVGGRWRVEGLGLFEKGPEWGVLSFLVLFVRSGF